MLQYPMVWNILNSLIEMQLLLRNGFALSQLDGDGMRVMEDQQKRHIKEVYMDSALRSLAGDRSSDSVSNLSFKCTHKIQQPRESMQC